MNIRKKDQETSLASVAGEVEMEEEGDGARLFQSEASNAAVRVCGSAIACACCLRETLNTRGGLV